MKFEWRRSFTYGLEYLFVVSGEYHDDRPLGWLKIYKGAAEAGVCYPICGLNDSGHIGTAVDIYELGNKYAVDDLQKKVMRKVENFINSQELGS